MIHKERITDIFFDLDHTLWDFEKNSALTFELIFKELDLGLEVNDFLSHYTPINHACWKLYRENKISQIELRTQRLENTFGMLEYEISTDQIQEISELYINNLSTFPHLFDGTHQLLAALKKIIGCISLRMVLKWCNILKSPIRAWSLILNILLLRKKWAIKSLILKFFRLP